MSLADLAAAARRAQRTLGSASPARRTTALRAVARLLREQRGAILEANQRDLEAAERDGLAAPLLARLKLSDSKLDGLCTGLEQLAERPDPIGEVLRRTELDDQLMLQQVASPLGVILIIFESRPDAVIQIGGLALRSGNAVILKGGSEARHSNRILVELLRRGLEEAGLVPEAVAGVEGREAVRELLELDHDIDLVIPRGSGALVRTIQQSTRIPVLGHAEGVCTLTIDAAADPEMAARLAVDGKCDYPAACNATETLLVHRDFLPRLPIVGRALVEAGVVLRADGRCRAYLPTAEPARREDGRTEYGDRILAVHAVDSLDEAIERIHSWGSGHTDAIVTEDEDVAAEFLRRVDSASVFHNASTRFADGFRYGLGAEVGISTGRIHARGPVGVEGLLTTRWLLRGAGQGAGEYASGERSFTHRSLPLTDA